MSGVSVKVIYGIKVVHPNVPPPFLDRIGNLVRPPFQLRRGLFHWQVATWTAPGYAVERRFWRKASATAELVRLALEGKEVKL